MEPRPGTPRSGLAVAGVGGLPSLVVTMCASAIASLSVLETLRIGPLTSHVAVEMREQRRRVVEKDIHRELNDYPGFPEH